MILRSNLTRGIENIPAQMLKDTLFEFSKKVRIFDFRWWRSYRIKGHLYLTINGILSSLKWYTVVRFNEKNRLKNFKKTLN
jgi:hypothetical protein